ncbi:MULTISPECIES: hypothetical protein [Sporomusa]|jgi:hypothetical protein|uniref:hypothetical protein n=1 Tax=Sporomusa TaxID=2375 RepID=UPI0016633101|nr:MULTISPECIES: hypothetical protein [Sporomusa]MCM0758813.1 hypothetical protein [Sporomusa sphaeroides DSM 2875]HML35698.1 hypothetical protein [Sporomusa sphaeroides]
MYQKMTRASLLLALMFLLQSLRLLMPIPAFVSMFVIGSAVNACLLAAVETAGWRAAILLAVIAPVIAYFQQALPLPVLILPVAAANIVYIAAYTLFFTTNRWFAVAAAAIAKMAGLYFSVSWLMLAVNIPDNLAAIITMMLSWPQLITGVTGGILCFVLLARRHNIKRQTAQ